VLGYNHQGDISSLSLAVLIGMIGGMASISLALLIASFAKNDLQAILLGAMLPVPLGFMAGAFLPLPRQVPGEVGGRTYVLGYSPVDTSSQCAAIGAHVRKRTEWRREL